MGVLKYQLGDWLMDTKVHNYDDDDEDDGTARRQQHPNVAKASNFTLTCRLRT